MTTQAMDNVVGAAPPLASHDHLTCRRKSVSKSVVVPINLTIHPQSSSSASTSSTSSSTSSSSSSIADFDLISIKPVSYTSLKDLLPSMAVCSPKPNSPAQSGSEDISIKNRLVKQAAWAYLQPMSTTPDSSGRDFLHCICIKLLLKNSLAALRSFFDRLNHAFDWLLWAVRFCSSR